MKFALSFLSFSLPFRSFIRLLQYFLSYHTWADNESCRTASECGDSLSFAFGVCIVLLSVRCTLCTIHRLSAAYALSDSLSTCTVHSCIRHVSHTLYVCAMWWWFRCEGKLQYTIFYFCKIKFSQSIVVRVCRRECFFTLFWHKFLFCFYFSSKKNLLPLSKTICLYTVKSPEFQRYFRRGKKKPHRKETKSMTVK